MNFMLHHNEPLFNQAVIVYIYRSCLYLQNAIIIFTPQTFDQFEFDGCDNCDDFLRMKNNKDNVFDCTSSNFDGYATTDI